MHWFKDDIQSSIDTQFLAKFETRDLFNHLLDARERLREVYEDDILKMISNNDFNKTAIVFVV
jgi:hypothetical protein